MDRNVWGLLSVSFYQIIFLIEMYGETLLGCTAQILSSLDSFPVVHNKPVRWTEFFTNRIWRDFCIYHLKGKGDSKRKIGKGDIPLVVPHWKLHILKAKHVISNKDITYMLLKCYESSFPSRVSTIIYNFLVSSQDFLTIMKTLYRIEVKHVYNIRKHVW